MGIYDGFKDVLDVVRKMDDVDLYRKIVDLQGQVVELTYKVHVLEDQKKELEQKLQLKANMNFRSPSWYMQGDSIPFCPKCYEGDGKPIHLRAIKGQFGDHHHCYTCKNDYYD